MTTPNAVTTRPKTELAPIDPAVIKRFPALDAGEREELLELLTENFDTDSGEAMSVKNLTMVKVPSGTSPAIFGYREDGQDKDAKEIEGVIIGWQNRRNYWESVEVTGERPDCSSRDGKIGEGMYGRGSGENPTGECGTCPMGQWSDGPDGARIPAPCKPQQAILLMVPDEVFPWYVQVPRTSQKGFKTYRADLLKKRKGVAQVTTKLTLNKIKAATKGAYDYYEIVFTMGDDLGRSAKKAALELGEAMMPILNAAPPVTSAADTDNVVPGEGGVTVATVHDHGGVSIDRDYSEEDVPA
jgi:hypothetical protein